MILGIDLGTHGVKTSEEVSFLSKVSEYEQFNEDNKIIYNGKEIYVGEGEFSTDWNKSRKENTLPLLYTAIHRSTKDNINSVVLGLPIQQFKRNKEILISLIRENRFANVNGRSLVIENVDVAPEAASAYYNLNIENRFKIKNKQLIIVDIGGRTTDICVFQGEKIIDVKTIATGMLNIYQEIINYINNKFTEEFRLEEAPDIIKDGLFLNGRLQDISFIQGILKNYFNSIYKEIQLKFNVTKGYLFLTGGGSLTFRKAFNNRLENVLMSNDPIFDNAKGNKKRGEMLWINH
ncbi:ParM/StbA family protein [Clostridium sp. HBUAS56017]|uniref:ParM/StbA family protein n=1 Tax=Clostridium sp. HBUAS56017 TaxID=2571128 RepID=UPI0011774451|nr:ParM/StbA family protein [Clostridium sp. HBUAS56017]